MVIFIDIFLKYYVTKSQYFILEKLYLIHGFYMVITTRSKSKFTMLITAEVRDYFESLIKPLVTNESDTIDRVQTKTIDRVHYIGKPVFDTVSKQKVRSVIANFKSWESRTFFYKVCPRNYLNGKKKPSAKSFSVSLDLTKRCYA